MRARKAPPKRSQTAEVTSYVPKAGRSGFWWSPDRQLIFHGDRRYAHNGHTATAPSHDLAHLMLAMGSDLPWLPRGTPERVRLAEYNAVFLENLLANTYNCVALKAIPKREILNETLRYARWFVETYYAPFPLAAEEAYRRFCFGIDARRLSSLAWYFFRQRSLELRPQSGREIWGMTVSLRAVARRPDRQFQQFDTLFCALIHQIARQGPSCLEQ